MNVCGRNILIMFVIPFFCGKITAQNNFTISVLLTKSTGIVNMSLEFENPSKKIILGKAKDGKIQLKGNIEQDYEHVYLKMFQKDSLWREFDFFIQKGEMKIEILRSANENLLKDSILYYNIPYITEQKIYDSLMKPFDDSITIVFNVLHNKNRDYSNKKLNCDFIENVLMDLRRKKLINQIFYIRSISDQYFSLYLFDKYLFNEFHLNADSLLSIYSAFSKSLKATKLGKSIFSYILKKQSLSLNRIMPDIFFITDKKKEYSLSRLRDKNMVLICFWDSYCAPCIKSLPILRKLNESYSGKGLQIISISIDNSYAKWSNALKEYNLPWLQTVDLPTYIRGKKIRSVYDIQYIPQYFLLDKNRRLIYHNVHSNDEDDYNVLQKILKKAFSIQK